MASGLLASGSVRYYHPADDLTEFTENLVWTDDNGALEFKPSIITSGITSDQFNTDAKIKFVIASGEYNDVQNSTSLTASVWLSGFLTDDNLASFFFAGFNDPVANVAYIEKSIGSNTFKINVIIDGVLKSRDWTPSPPQDDDWHFFTVDLRQEASGWRHRISLDGGPFLDLGLDDILNTPNANVQTLIQSRSRTDGSRNIAEEIVFWADNAIFTDQELSNLYQLFNNFDTTMDQYDTIYDVNAVRDMDLFISGVLPQSGTLTANATLFLTGHEISNNNVSLSIKSNGASGMLDPENVIFYHPLDNKIEHTLTETWDGSGVFVAGAIGSGVSAVTPSNLFFGDSSGAFDLGSNVNHNSIDKIDTDKVIITASVLVASQFEQHAVIGSFSGFDIIYGSEVFVRTGNMSVGVTALTPSTSVLISQGPSNTGAARVASISGLDIMLGSDFNIVVLSLIFALHIK